MKILFTSDLHGRKDLYGQMLALARDTSTRCVVIGGDLLPTMIRSPLKLVTGGFEFDESLQAQMDFIDSFLAPFFNEFSRQAQGARLLYIPGNHDWETAFTHLVSSSPGALCLHGAQAIIEGVAFAGYGCVTDSSFWVKDYVRRDTPADGFVKSRYPFVSTAHGITPSDGGAYALNRPSIEEELAGIALDDPEQTVCVFHSPPHGTGIDTLHTGKPIGSKAITGFIRRVKPLASLHGHIHEAPYMTGSCRTMIGPTLAVNPGHDPKKLHAVLFDSNDPASTLTHSVFGTGPVTRTGLAVVTDRYVRLIKGFFMKKVLMR